MALVLSLLAIGAMGADSGATIAFRDRIEGSPLGRALSLADVADLRHLPPALEKRAARLVIISSSLARVAPGITHAAIAARARALLPALGPWLAQEYPGSLRLAKSRSLDGRICADRDQGVGIVAGEEVKVRVRTGPFLIERTGYALQPALPGHRFFVRTPDGALSVSSCGGEQ